MQHHADLLDAEFWQTHKERILAGHVYDVFPYSTGRRFTHLGAGEGANADVRANTADANTDAGTDAKAAAAMADPTIVLTCMFFMSEPLISADGAS